MDCRSLVVDILRVSAMTFRAALSILILAMVVQTAVAQAQDHLQEMPDPNRVLADMQGSDALDTAARQLGALYQLKMLLVDLKPQPFGKQSAAEERLHKAYFDAMRRVQEPKFDDEETRRLGMASPRAKWFGSKTHYETDKAFRDELMRRYLSEPTRVAYRAIEERRAQLLEHAELQRERQGEAAEQQRFDDNMTALVAASLRPLMFLSMGVFLVLFIVGMVGETRPFGLDPSNRFRLEAGKTHYDVHSMTGTVVSPSKAIETVTRVSTGGNTGVSSSSQRYVHDQFFLRTPDGDERAFKAVNADLALRDGHQMSVAWAIRDGRDSGPCIVYRNHTTGDRQVRSGLLRDMLRPKAWPAWPLAALAWLVVGGGAGFMLAIAVLIAFSILRRGVARRRLRRFEETDIPALLAIFDARARDQPEPGLSAVQ